MLNREKRKNGFSSRNTRQSTDSLLVYLLKSGVSSPVKLSDVQQTKCIP